MPVRKPAVAGYFYPATPSALRKRIEWCFKHELGPGRLPQVNKTGERKVLGLISPHAGYIYSGPVAAHGFYLLAEDGIPDVAIILGPKHEFWGASIAIYPEGSWETPLGVIEVDSDLARKIAEESGVAELDEMTHEGEHSIEVQVPFLQFLYGNDIKIVPICILSQDLYLCSELGRGIARAIRDVNAVIIASTDFTHYEPQEKAVEADRKAISAIQNLDSRELYRLVIEEHLTMCGYGPVIALIEAFKELGGGSVELLKYATSGDITKDYSAVVGYASIAFLKA